MSEAAIQAEACECEAVLRCRGLWESKSDSRERERESCLSSAGAGRSGGGDLKELYNIIIICI